MKIFYSKFKYLLTGLLILISTNLIAAVTSLQGKGTAVEPYLIHTVDELIWMRDQVNNNNALFGDRHYKLMNDLDFTGQADWIPIGENADYSFTGSFDGSQKIIQNLRIGYNADPAKKRYAGIFGYVSKGELVNIRAKSISIHAISFIIQSSVMDDYCYAGGIVGFCEGLIQNCYVEGDIYASCLSDVGRSFVGGVAGNLKGHMFNCQVDVNISSFSPSDTYDSSYAGGIIGYLEGSVKDSYSVVSLSSTSYAGGVVGKALGDISGCYCSGVIRTVPDTPYSYTGGIVGYCEGNIINCHTSGNVLSSFSAFIMSSYVGGIVGFLLGDLYNSYSLASVVSSYYYSFAGGVVGFLVSGNLQNCYASGDVSALSYSLFSSNNSPSYAGGIVGKSRDNVSHCYGLNKKVMAIQSRKYSTAYSCRIGFKEIGTYYSNFANKEMSVMIGMNETDLLPVNPVGENHGADLNDDLAHLLNEWVRLNQTVDNAYKEWVVTEGVNNGYPVFADIATSIDKPKFAENATIRSTRGAVLVENAIMPIRVTNLSGLTVRQVMSPSDRELITLPKGFYVVSVGDKSEKVFVN